MIRWSEQSPLPRGVAALLDSLRWDRPAGRPLTDAEWKEALPFADRFQLSLLLENTGAGWAGAQIERNRARNREHTRRILCAFTELNRAASGLDFAILKGFANWEFFPVDRDHRTQYDLDLFCPDHADRIRDALLRLGYEPIESPLTLARKSQWKWNGDFYDPEIPVAIDLHTGLWDEAMEGFRAPGVEEFWPRRIWRTVEGLRYSALAPVDALAFSALHMLRHLLHGDARPVQVYEIAGFLETHSAANGFWSEWRRLHPPELRRLQAVGFRLAEEWFGCRMHETPQVEIALLPANIRRWFERYAASPLTAFFQPNKDELALHLCLLEGAGAKARVVRRRLLPARWPRPFSYAVARGMFHLRAFAPAVSTMLKMRD